MQSIIRCSVQTSESFLRSLQLCCQVVEVTGNTAIQCELQLCWRLLDECNQIDFVLLDGCQLFIQCILPQFALCSCAIVITAYAFWYTSTAQWWHPMWNFSSQPIVKMFIVQRRYWYAGMQSALWSHLTLNLPNRLVLYRGNLLQCVSACNTMCVCTMFILVTRDDRHAGWKQLTIYYVTSPVLYTNTSLNCCRMVYHTPRQAEMH